VHPDGVHAGHPPRRDRRALIPVLCLLAVVWPAALVVLIAMLIRPYVLASRRASLSAFVGACLLAGVAWPFPGADPAGDLRTLATGSSTVAALAWGSAHHGTVHHRDGLIVVTGMRGGYGWRRGVTVGRVFLTGDAEPKGRLLRHERRHRDQWVLWGGALPILYGSAELLGRTAGAGSSGNVFEAAAGFRDGGYAPPSRATPVLAGLLRLVSPGGRAGSSEPSRTGRRYPAPRGRGVEAILILTAPDGSSRRWRRPAG
jgi:hypothetical protein